jgi:hypothetical protein
MPTDTLGVYYEPWQIDRLLNLYFRNQPRPAPWGDIAEAMQVEFNPVAHDRLLWGVVTGYPGNTAEGPRKEYTPTSARIDRTGFVWYAREDKLVRAALGGQGQRRQPPCDVAFVARVLARPEAEVAERWAHLQKDALGREAFFK